MTQLLFDDDSVRNKLRGIDDQHFQEETFEGHEFECISEYEPDTLMLKKTFAKILCTGGYMIIGAVFHEHPNHTRSIEIVGSNCRANGVADILKGYWPGISFDTDRGEVSTSNGSIVFAVQETTEKCAVKKTTSETDTTIKTVIQIRVPKYDDIIFTKYPKTRRLGDSNRAMSHPWWLATLDETKEISWDSDNEDCVIRMKDKIKFGSKIENEDAVEGTYSDFKATEWWKANPNDKPWEEVVSDACFKSIEKQLENYFCPFLSTSTPSKPSTLYMGYSDSGRAVGYHLSEECINDLASKLTQVSFPPYQSSVRYEVYEVEFPKYGKRIQKPKVKIDAMHEKKLKNEDPKNYSWFIPTNNSNCMLLVGNEECDDVNKTTFTWKNYEEDNDPCPLPMYVIHVRIRKTRENQISYLHVNHLAALSHTGDLMNCFDIWGYYYGERMLQEALRRNSRNVLIKFCENDLSDESTTWINKIVDQTSFYVNQTNVDFMTTNVESSRLSKCNIDTEILLMCLFDDNKVKVPDLRRFSRVFNHLQKLVGTKTKIFVMFVCHSFDFMNKLRENVDTTLTGIEFKICPIDMNLNHELFKSMEPNTPKQIDQPPYPLKHLNHDSSAISQSSKDIACCFLHGNQACYAQLFFTESRLDIVRDCYDDLRKLIEDKSKTNTNRQNAYIIHVRSKLRCSGRRILVLRILHDLCQEHTCISSIGKRGTCNKDLLSNWTKTVSTERLTIAVDEPQLLKDLVCSFNNFKRPALIVSLIEPPNGISLDREFSLNSKLSPDEMTKLINVRCTYDHDGNNAALRRLLKQCEDWFKEVKSNIAPDVRFCTQLKLNGFCTFMTVGIVDMQNKFEPFKSLLESVGDEADFVYILALGRLFNVQFNCAQTPHINNLGSFMDRFEGSYEFTSDYFVLAVLLETNQNCHEIFLKVCTYALTSLYSSVIYEDYASQILLQREQGCQRFSKFIEYLLSKYHERITLLVDECIKACSAQRFSISKRNIRTTAFHLHILQSRIYKTIYKQYKTDYDKKWLETMREHAVTAAKHLLGVETVDIGTVYDAQNNCMSAAHNWFTIETFYLCEVHFPTKQEKIDKLTEWCNQLKKFENEAVNCVITTMESLHDCIGSLKSENLKQDFTDTSAKNILETWHVAPKDDTLDGFIKCFRQMQRENFATTLNANVNTRTAVRDGTISFSHLNVPKECFDEWMRWIMKEETTK